MWTVAQSAKKSCVFKRKPIRVDWALHKHYIFIEVRYKRLNNHLFSGDFISMICFDISIWNVKAHFHSATFSVDITIFFVLMSLETSHDKENSSVHGKFRPRKISWVEMSLCVFMVDCSFGTFTMFSLWSITQTSWDYLCSMKCLETRTQVLGYNRLYFLI